MKEIAKLTTMQQVFRTFIWFLGFISLVPPPVNSAPAPVAHRGLRRSAFNSQSIEFQWQQSWIFTSTSGSKSGAPQAIDICIPDGFCRNPIMSSFCPYTVASTQLFDSPISTAAPLGMFTKVQNKLPRVSFDTVGADVPVSTNKYALPLRIP